MHYDGISCCIILIWYTTIRTGQQGDIQTWLSKEKYYYIQYNCIILYINYISWPSNSVMLKKSLWETSLSPFPVLVF